MHQNRLIYTLPQYQQKLRAGYNKLGVFLKNNETNSIHIFRPIPNCPWLPESRKKYFRKLRNRLESLPTSKKYTFATLTYSARTYSPAAASERIKHDIDLFFKRLGYHHRKVQYFYVIELTDNLLPHIHLVFDQYIPWQKLRKTWVKVTGNSVTNIKHLPQKQVFWYILKYLTDSRKQSETKWSFLFENIDRIWSCSRGFLLASKTSAGSFQFMFCLWDPNGITRSSFINPDKDLISGAVDYGDAVLIAGFPDRFPGCRILNSHEDWTFVSEFSHSPATGILKRSTFMSTQLLYDFYVRH